MSKNNLLLNNDFNETEMFFENLSKRDLSKEKLTKDEIKFMLSLSERNDLDKLFAFANSVRLKNHGKIVHIRAIIEFSNYCRCDCCYCGMQVRNKELPRYRMTREEILENVDLAVGAGYKTVILQSGEDMYYTKEFMGELIGTIRRKYPTLTITLSLGERPRDHYSEWYEAGANRYLIKHETSNVALYGKYHPHSTFENRLNCQSDLYDLGYDLGGGFMIGLPGQTLDDLANDILLLDKMKVAMAGIGPFIAHGKTQLGANKDGDPLLTLKAVAITRILMGKVDLPSTTALNIKGGMNQCLLSGANVIMQKATPAKYRDLYEIYPGREQVYVDLKKQRDDALVLLEKMGLQGL